jgi:hypothetical protein
VGLADRGSIACYVIGWLGIAGFVWAERRIGDDALLPLRLFRGKTFAIGMTLNTLIGIGMFGGLAPCRSTCRSSRATARPRPAC